MKKYFYDKYDAGKTFFWAILVPQLLGLALTFIFTIISVFIVRSDPSLSAELVYNRMLNNIFSKLLLALIPQMAFLLIYVFFNSKKDFVRASRLVRPGWQNMLVCGVLGVALVFLLSPISSYVAEGLVSLGLKMDLSLPLPLDNGWWLLLNLVVLALIPAICEELIFRGMILNGLRELGKTKAILLSATLFMLMHASPIQTVFPFLFGLVLAYIVYETGSIYPAMLVHFINNALVIIFNYVGFNYSFGEIPFWAGMLISIAFVGVAVLVTWLAGKLLKKKEITKPIEEELSENETITTNVKTNYNLILGIIIGCVLWLMVLITGFTTGV